MFNPILQQLNGSNSPINKLINMKQNMDPNQMFNNMYANNPQFKSFVDQNRGKTPQQIAQENGLDWNTVQKLL